jgi:hypothetical protein
MLNVGKNLLQLSDMLAIWWSDDSTLFDAVWKLLIGKSKGLVY